MSLSRFAQACGLLAVALGLWGLLSWGVNKPALTTLGTAGWPIAPKSALAFVLLGSALMVHLWWPAFRSARACATAAILLALLLCGWSLLESYTSFRLEIEARMFHPPARFNNLRVFSMPHIIMLSVALASLALLGMVWKPAGQFAASAGLFGLGLVALNLFVIFGCVYEAPLLYEHHFRPVNLLAATAGFCIGLGLASTAGPRHLPLSALAGPSVTSRLLRRFIPATFLMMLLGAILFAALPGKLLSEPAVRDSLRVVLSIGPVVLAALLAARRTGRDLEEAESALNAIHQELDHRVQQRTAELARANEELRLEIARRQRTEAALRESTATFAALETIIPAFVMIHRQGKCLYANKAAELILDRTGEELRNCPPWELLHPDYRETARERMLKREAGEPLPPGSLDYPFLTSKGQIRWLDIAAMGIEFQGQPAVLACGLDITQRRQMEENLRYNEERFRQVVEQIREVFWATDVAKQQMIYISPAYETIWGRSCQSLYDSPTNWLDAILPEDRERVRNAAFTLQARGKYHVTYRIRRPDGAIRWIEDRAFPVRNKQGEVYRVTGIAEDITERKKADEELCNSEAQFRTLFEAAPIGIALHDVNGRYLKLNRAYCQMLSYAKAELLRSGTRRVTVPDDVPEGIRLFEELRDGKRDSYTREKRYRARDGRIVHAIAAASAVRHSDGQLLYIISMVLDVTERKRLQQEILEVSAREQQRLGHELHDGLGQYLSGIAFKTKCLEDSLRAQAPALAEDARELVRLVNNANGQARSLARGLDPVEIEVGGLVSALQHLAWECEKLFSISCRFRSNQLTVPLDTSAALHLFRIAQEAINNAARHGRARQVDLELDVDAETLRLAIRDNGKGFQPGRKPGQGMGLRIMAYRADSLGGTLKVQPLRGSGTEVQCLLPKLPRSSEADQKGLIL